MVMRPSVPTFILAAAVVAGCSSSPGSLDAQVLASGEAHVWIDANGGACAVSAMPVQYADGGDDSSCATFDEAWDAMSAGQTARVVAGTYGPQRITGAKSSETKIIGDTKAATIVAGNVECFDPAEFGSSSAMCAMADYLTLESMTFDSGAGESNSSSAARPHGEHVTFRDVDLRGEFPNLYITGAFFTWQRGSHGKDDLVPPPRKCDRSYGMPVWVLAPNVTLDGVRFNVKRIEAGAGPYCGADDTPHLENIRIESEGNHLTVANSWFVAGSDAGSGHIFTSTSPTHLTIHNNVFEAVNGTYAIQGSIGVEAVLAYNTFLQSASITFTGDAMNSAERPSWVGNLGVASGCEGNHLKNVWQGTGSCGTDTFVGDQSLGVGSGGHLAALSPAIDAAELPAAHDYCTAPEYLRSLDRDGEPRPKGAACDAGAHEY